LAIALVLQKSKKTNKAAARWQAAIRRGRMTPCRANVKRGVVLEIVSDWLKPLRRAVPQNQRS
jgi:hypothetical protein